MEAELEALIKQQIKGEEPVSEDRIAWQVIRALSTTMGHLSKDAIRKKGKRMLSHKETSKKSLPAGEAAEGAAAKRMRTEDAPSTSTATALEPGSNVQPDAAVSDTEVAPPESGDIAEEPPAQASLPPPVLPQATDTAPAAAE